MARASSCLKIARIDPNSLTCIHPCIHCAAPAQCGDSLYDIGIGKILDSLMEPVFVAAACRGNKFETREGEVRAAGYLRVSSESQVDGNSLAAQERLFKELCKSRNWQLVGIYREEGKSAHSESIRHRPVFRQILEDAAKNRFDAVVVHTLDRWSRNLRVTLESLTTLAEHDVGLVSITENIDYSTAQGKPFTQMLGSFAEYFSESLATHVKKGQGQRARDGRHLGGIPFGYRSCWSGKDGQRVLHCDPEHPGGIHLVPEERNAIKELFERYARVTATTASLAIWLNEQGFRTRNTKRLPTPGGESASGPRHFTNASVRVILHNPFYAGLVKHKKERFRGQHEPVIGAELFEAVQLALRKNSGRSSTIGIGKKLNRTYLLRGLARCADCGMNLWAQTYVNGQGSVRTQGTGRITSSETSRGAADAVPALPVRVHHEEKEQNVSGLSDLLLP